MSQATKRWLLVCLVVLLTPWVAEACPTCKDGLAENSMHLVRGYGWSIMFMMSMPFLILGGIATYFYLLVRKANRTPSEPPTTTPDGPSYDSRVLASK